jgi:hypothetical protein
VNHHGHRLITKEKPTDTEKGPLKEGESKRRELMPKRRELVSREREGVKITGTPDIT